MVGLRISQAAERSGVSASTLRYYDKIGLLSAPRSDRGYRIYDQPTRDRLAFVLSVKRLGLPLPMIQELVVARDHHPCSTVHGRVREFVDRQLDEVRAQIVALQQMERDLVDGRARLDAIPTAEVPCQRTCAFQQTTRSAVRG